MRNFLSKLFRLRFRKDKDSATYRLLRMNQRLDDQKKKFAR